MSERVHSFCLCKRGWGKESQKALGGPGVPKGRDEMGYQTIAKFGKQTLNSGRHVSHGRSIKTSQQHKQVEADNMASLKDKLLEGTMHKDTGIFEVCNYNCLSSAPKISASSVALSSNQPSSSSAHKQKRIDRSGAQSPQQWPLKRK